MATKTPNRTTPRKITPTKAGLASKNATAERETAKKEKAAVAPKIAPPVAKEAVDLLADKPKPVRRAVAPGIKGFKPLAAISKIREPEPPKKEPEPLPPEPAPAMPPPAEPPTGT